jgi:hypothetical protein
MGDHAGGYQAPKEIRAKTERGGESTPLPPSFGMRLRPSSVLYSGAAGAWQPRMLQVPFATRLTSLLKMPGSFRAILTQTGAQEFGKPKHAFKKMFSLRYNGA